MRRCYYNAKGANPLTLAIKQSSWAAASQATMNTLNNPVKFAGLFSAIPAAGQQTLTKAASMKQTSCCARNADTTYWQSNLLPQGIKLAMAENVATSADRQYTRCTDLRNQERVPFFY